MAVSSNDVRTIQCIDYRYSGTWIKINWDGVAKTSDAEWQVAVSDNSADFEDAPGHGRQINTDGLVRGELSADEKRDAVVAAGERYGFAINAEDVVIDRDGDAIWNAE